MSKFAESWGDETIKSLMAIQNRRKRCGGISIALTIVFIGWMFFAAHEDTWPVLRFFPVFIFGFVSIGIAWLYLRFDSVLVMKWEEDGRFVPFKIFSHRELMRRDPDDDYQSPFWWLWHYDWRILIVPFPGSRGKNHLILGKECKLMPHFIRCDLLEDHNAWSIRLLKPSFRGSTTEFTVSGPKDSRARMSENTLNYLLYTMFGNEDAAWRQFACKEGFELLSLYIGDNKRKAEELRKLNKGYNETLNGQRQLRDDLDIANSRIKAVSRNRKQFIDGIVAVIRQIRKSTRLQKTKEGATVLNALLAVLGVNANSDDRLPLDINTLLMEATTSADAAKPAEPAPAEPAQEPPA